jgi:hypothetical protein
MSINQKWHHNLVYREQFKTKIYDEKGDGNNDAIISPLNSPVLS